MWSAAQPLIDVTQFSQYGAIGVGIIALAIFAHRAYNREVQRSEGLQQRLDDTVNKLIATHEVIQDRVIPALQESTRSAQETITFIQSLMHDVEIDRVKREARGHE